ncbi:hypothetical protein CGZ93_08010 [Enemella dayhoffiae]|uniref:Uncharacterized protein n=1 Tax=Enemella dayhoffiae TaxID=2016507 RepID=A0A255H2Q4_9ACTN|nr:hypothetical protein [Enemella dayhoffiae]OYO21881.1 hypothetical protein CGZ93_08010 [Enemella dayhoffiae]
MTESQNPEEQAAATEAAQNVVDEVTSYEYSGEKDRISGQLDQGLDEAGVDLPESEKSRLVDEIDDRKDEDPDGGPEVGSANPA